MLLLSEAGILSYYQPWAAGELFYLRSHSGSQRCLWYFSKGRISHHMLTQVFLTGIFVDGFTELLWGVGPLC